MGNDGPAATEYVMIDKFLIDCAIRENHTFDSDVTEYPVESGGKITDNIQPRPIVVEIEGLVTNTPIGIIATRRQTLGAELSLTATRPSDMMYDFFMRLRDDRKTFPIQTSLRTYNNMALKGLNIPRGDHMDDIKFTATFQQIQSLENKRTVRVSTPIGKGGGGGGKKVSKSGTPWPGRTILIDKRVKAWWDPDIENVYGVAIGGWRSYAVFSNRVITRRADGSTLETFGPYRWNIYRGMPLTTSDTGSLERTPTSGTVSLKPPNSQGQLEDEAESRWKQIVAVTEGQYYLQGFTIKTPPGGITQPEYKDPPPNVRPR